MRISLPVLVVVRRELVQQLLDPVLLPQGVDVGDAVLRKAGEVQVDLEKVQKEFDCVFRHKNTI